MFELYAGHRHAPAKATLWITPQLWIIADVKSHSAFRTTPASAAA